MEFNYVPCQGCTACCHGPVILHPGLGDEPSRYECEFVENVGYRLKRKPDGSCIYLRDSACSIWPATPGVCRAFDCRRYIALDCAKDDPFGTPEIRAAALARLTV